MMSTSTQSNRTGRRVALLAILSMCLIAVTDHAWGQSTRQNLVETAVAAGKFDTLVAAVKAAGLVDTLQQPGPLTVFAPTDAAFDALPKGTLEMLLRPENKETLTAILTYHVLPARVSARAAFGLDYAATANGARLHFERRAGKLVIGGAKLLATDLQCSNGVIHVIDRVLLPEKRRIPALAKENGQFATLLAAASAAGLADVLNGDGPLTVFAPTDAAFAKLPEGTVETLLKPENKGKLVDILKYHVVSGRVYSDQAAKARRASTLLGRGVETSVTADGLRINNALVVSPDLEAANGVVHVIDSVLLPQAMNHQQARRTLEDAIRRGVPVYNHGDHQACATIYTGACRAIVGSESAEIPHDVMTVLQTTLHRAERIHHAGARAWALRYGMDAALAGLRQMSLAGTDSNDG